MYVRMYVCMLRMHVMYCEHGMCCMYVMYLVYLCVVCMLCMNNKYVCMLRMYDASAC